MNPGPGTMAAPTHDSPLARRVRELCLEGHSSPGPDVRRALPTREEWRALRELGTNLWLDSGDVEAVRKLWTREFTALTTNNTLLNKEVQKGIYDGLVARAARALRQAEPRIGPDALVTEIAFILNAVHGLQLVRTFDADVSVELHTDLAWDVDAGCEYGRRFHAICPDWFIVKVPLTVEGIFIARRLMKDGIRINFTLGFSARQNYLISTVAQPDYVNVFLGRLNAFIADNKLGDGVNVGEKATLASQRVVRIVNESQARQVKQIAASIRNGQQVRDLSGVDVLTIPTAAAEEYVAHKFPPSEIKDRTARDPEVRFREGLDPLAEKIHVFWESRGLFAEAMTELSNQELDDLTPASLRDFLKARALGDLFPALLREDRQRLAADGKIPVYTTWRDRVKKGEVSWDALMTEAALASFASDQKKLDERVRKLL